MLQTCGGYFDWQFDQDLDFIHVMEVNEIFFVLFGELKRPVDKMW